MTKENQIEENLIKQLTELKYVYRPDIVNRKTLEQNFKNKKELALIEDLVPQLKKLAQGREISGLEVYE